MEMISRDQDINSSPDSWRSQNTRALEGQPVVTNQDPPMSMKPVLYAKRHVRAQRNKPRYHVQIRTYIYPNGHTRRRIEFCMRNSCCLTLPRAMQPVVRSTRCQLPSLN